MTTGNQMQAFAIQLRRLALFLFCIGCASLLGCKAKSTGERPGPGGTDTASYTKKVYARSDSPSNAVEKQGYEGGDPDIYHPPEHRGQGKPLERAVVVPPSGTPTPPPDRPIDRPLDAAGRPVASPSPED